NRLRFLINLATSVRSSRKIAHLNEDKKRLHQLFLFFLASEQTDFAFYLRRNDRWQLSPMNL
ncbi:hypothetical protein P4U44_06485, partial [Alkalihalobacillus alcalophilus]|uniref:hypothetical protein n=1 Tax=Alkalihalobacillus alcalophilus TaxID=1445 RepID=UPI002E1F3458|nr:hypothetical protein [Alkalihalobacillus alcalophilus]